MFRDGTGVHESLRGDGETSVDDGRLVNVENKLGVFDYVYPESENWEHARYCIYRKRAMGVGSLFVRQTLQTISNLIIQFASCAFFKKISNSSRKIGPALHNTQYFKLLQHSSSLPQRQRVALPGVRYFGIDDAVFFRLFVEIIEQIFDGERQDLAAMRRREDRLEEVVDKLLQSSLRGKKTRQVDFGDHLGRAIDGVGDRIGAASAAATTTV